jgi:hypothetical protein
MRIWSLGFRKLSETARAELDGRTGRHPANEIRVGLTRGFPLSSSKVTPRARRVPVLGMRTPVAAEGLMAVVRRCLVGMVVLALGFPVAPDLDVLCATAIHDRAPVKRLDGVNGGEVQANAENSVAALSSRFCIAQSNSIRRLARYKFRAAAAHHHRRRVCVAGIDVGHG